MNNYRMRKGFKFVGFVIAASLLAGLVVMLLWNALLPVIFGVAKITLIQAIGLLILSRILFGGFPGRRRGYGGHPRHKKWREKMKAKWQNMSEEEREAMKAKMPWKKFGAWNDPADEEKPEAD